MSTPSPDAAAASEVQAVLGAPPARGRRADWLLEYLHRLDEQWGGLHDAHLAALAQELGVPLQEVLGAADAGGNFTVLRAGEQAAALRLTACMGLPCGIAGAEAVRAALPALLPPDVALRASPCLGRCHAAPVVLVGQVPVERASAESVLNALLLEADRAPGEMGQARGAGACEAYDTYRASGGYRLAAALANGQADAARVLQVIDASGLQDSRGSVAARWREAQLLPAPRCLVVDLARGEPGAFAPRQLLEREPHGLLEGVLLAALVIGADAVAIDVHASWHDARVVLAAELGRLRANGSFPQVPLELQRGAARAVPAALRLEFEPLFALRELLERGPDWRQAHGRRQRHGLRTFSLSGRVRRPGVKLAPAGISLRELIFEHCDGMAEGHELQAWLPGGASSALLPADLADLPLDAGSLQPHGATLGEGGIVVLSQQDGDAAAVLAGRHGAGPP